MKFRHGLVLALVVIAAGCVIPEQPSLTTKPGGSSSARPKSSAPPKTEKIANSKAKPAIAPADNGPPPTVATTPSPVPTGTTIQVPAFSGAVVGNEASLPKVDETNLPKGTIRLQNGFFDKGDGTSEAVRFWLFETEAKPSREELTYHQPAPLYRIVDESGQQIGQTVFSVVPGDLGYSPYWRVFDLHVPKNYIPNSIRSFREVNEALKHPGFWLEDRKLAFNCPVVAEGTQLEGAADAIAQFNWVNGKRAYYFTFDYLPVTIENGLPFVQTAPIWSFSAKDATQVIKNYDPAKAVSTFRFLNQDLGASAGVDTNAIITVLPKSNNPAGSTISTLQFPETGTYSSLWLVTKTTVPDNYDWRSAKLVADLADTAGFKKEKVSVLWNAPLLDTLKKRTTPTSLTTPAPTASVSPAAAPSVQAVSFKNTITPIVKLHCARCHHPSGQASFAAFATDASGTTADHAVVSSKIQAMISRIESGSMPRDKATTVTATEIKALKDWMEAGTPNN